MNISTKECNKNRKVNNFRYLLACTFKDISWGENIKTNIEYNSYNIKSHFSLILYKQNYKVIDF